MKVLVLNAGSSSLKFDLWDTDPEHLLLRDEVERVDSMTIALEHAFEKIGPAKIDAVGHRVVHGGDLFHASVIITPEVEQGIEELSSLAPLHNPHNLEAIRAARRHLPHIPHVAVFDTAFHRTLPPHAYAYALPYEYLTGKKIRRYGFHGISHRYVSGRFRELYPDHGARLVVCHLGNGCSVCAVQDGHSIDTSMGFTPLEGLVMGTRSGDVDAGAVLHLISHEKQDPAAVAAMLNSDSGLKGLSGISNDMRDVLAASEQGSKRAQLAVDTFCYRLTKYIGSYIAALGGIDALIFTAGIGEHAPEIRRRVCQNLDYTGVMLDNEANNSQAANDRLSNDRPIGTKVWVIPTQEELLIARDTRACCA